MNFWIQRTESCFNIFLSWKESWSLTDFLNWFSVEFNWMWFNTFNSNLIHYIIQSQSILITLTFNFMFWLDMCLQICFFDKHFWASITSKGTLFDVMYLYFMCPQSKLCRKCLFTEFTLSSLWMRLIIMIFQFTDIDKEFSTRNTLMCWFNF